MDDSILFKGQIIYFLKDKYGCIHMAKRNSKSAAKLEKYTDFVESLKKKWKSDFIKAYVVNLEEQHKPYVWSSNIWRKDLPSTIKGNHKIHNLFLEENRQDVIFIGPYKNKKTKGLHLCSNGHEWLEQPLKVRNGATCPKCKRKSKESKGVKYITKLLADKKVEFIKEVSLDRLGHDSKKRLDFLVCKNHYPLFAIEFNGIQHYKLIRNDFFGSYKGHKNRNTSDKIKREFCWSVGLPVIDIPYTETEEQIKETIYYFLDLFNALN